MDMLLSPGNAIALALAVNAAYFNRLRVRSERWDWLEQLSAWVGKQLEKQLLRRLKPGWYA